MNNFYALIYLTETLKNKCKGKTFQFSTSPHKDVWDCYLSENNSRFRLKFSTNPEETALFIDSYRPPKKANTTPFFEVLSGQSVQEISMAENDRFITITFDNEYSLMFQIFGNTPNIFLIRDNTIIESFKSPDDFEGQTPPEPRKASPTKTPSEDDSAKRVITKLDPKFPRHLIPFIIDEYGLEKKTVPEIKEVVNTLIEAMLNRPEFRVLDNGNLCLIPEDLLPAENLEVFENINSAIRHAYYKASNERRLESRRQSIKPKIDRIINKYESTIEQLKHADKGLKRADKYERYGHILMAHAHEKNEFNESVTFPDLYNPDEKVQIQLKPKLSLAENAQYYYEKANKSRRNVEESKRRLGEIKIKLKKLKKLQQSLNEIDKIYEFRDWYKENEDALFKAGVLKAETQKKKPPYRILEIDGYTIWVGKNAKSNDQLTTDAHKEDVWMHARGVSGSHVVIRMDNHKEMPPKKTLLKAAAVAAWNSKARGSGLAPVIITKRKYVVKPKGAPAGTVRVNQEEVEMVKPQKIPA
ncbi:MAG: NFACT RNA binding domain-containing protein [Balneolaceae bacterium]|nr:NFACT RNA binding domain-containing protein [Balneolaceae bacterium]